MKTIIASSLLSLGFLLNIVWIYDSGSSLFSYHPPLMLAGQIFAVQSIALFGVLERKWRLTVHWILGGISLALFLLGFIAIYINKDNYFKPHFTSWHGLFGLTVILLLIGQTLGGILAKYHLSIGSIMHHKLIKKGHRWNGIAVPLLSFLTISLVLQLLSPLWLTYFVTVITPSTVLLVRVLQKLMGVKQKDKKSKE